MSDEIACPVCGTPTGARCLICAIPIASGADECGKCLAFLGELARSIGRARNLPAVEVLEPSTPDGLAASLVWRVLVALAETNPPGEPS